MLIACILLNSVDSIILIVNVMLNNWVNEKLKELEQSF